MAHTTLYFLAVFSLSTAPNWAKLSSMPAEIMGFWRLFFAFVILASFIAVRKQKMTVLKDKNLKWAVTSAFFFFLHLWSYKYAAKNTLVANMMILFASNPIWASLGGYLFFKEKLSLRIVISYFVALAGIILLFSDSFALSAEQNFGNMIALTSAFFYAAYMLTSKQARQTMDNINYACVQYSFTAICFLGISLITQAEFFDYNPISWVALAGVVLISTLIGHLSFTYLVKHMNISLMTCGKLIEPVIASVLAYFIFSEKIGQNAAFSFSLIALSVISLFWPQIKLQYKTQFKTKSQTK